MKNTASGPPAHRGEKPDGRRVGQNSGVAGVGEKTALALIQDFGSLAGVYENIDDARIKKGVREKLLRDKRTGRDEPHAGRDRVQRARKRRTRRIQKDAPDAPAAARLLTDLEMYARWTSCACPPKPASAAGLTMRPLSLWWRRPPCPRSRALSIFAPPEA